MMFIQCSNWEVVAGINIVLLLLWSEKICKTKTIIGAAEDEDDPYFVMKL